MARPLRIEYPGALYHVTSRGNAGQPIYATKSDRALFLDLLAKAIERFNWICHAYCLMGNHYHVLVETVDPTLSRGMRHLNGVYTQRFNRLSGRSGHLFQGRYKAILVEKDSYLLELVRYIVLNPVRAKLVRSCKNWKWSSYCATAGLEAVPPFLHVDTILSQFGTQRSSARRAFRRFVAQGKDIAVWSSLRGQIYLGSDEFIAQNLPNECAGLQEIPREQRLASRPSLARIFEHSTADRSIAEAYRTHGYRLKEIGEHLGIHYSTVSRRLARHERKQT